MILLTEVCLLPVDIWWGNQGENQGENGWFRGSGEVIAV